RDLRLDEILGPEIPAVAYHHNRRNKRPQRRFEQKAAKVDGELLANDGMAGAVITALTARHLNGKVLVTGQDASDASPQRILAGNQTMSVYKAIKREAKRKPTEIIQVWENR